MEQTNKTMSNYSQFFPEGDTSIKRNPNDLPIIYLEGDSIGNVADNWYRSNVSYNSATNVASNSSINPLTGTNASFNQNLASATQTANTEATLLNITSGSGFLCNVITATSGDSDSGSNAGTQTIKITVDGTEYTFSYDLSSTTDGTRLLWGYHSRGDFYTTNLSNDTTAVGFMGNGGLTHQPSLSLPTYVDVASNTYHPSVKIYSVHEFIHYNLPRLRFETSLTVKVTNTTMSSDSAGDAFQMKGGCSYILDTTVV